MSIKFRFGQLLGAATIVSTTFSLAPDPVTAADKHMHAQHQIADYSANRFAVTVEKLADDIYLMRRPLSWRSTVQANVTVIINDSDVVVIDGGVPAHVENVVAEIKKLTKKPVSRIITTHWHQDHNWGNFVYKKHYPNAKVISHINTKKTLEVYDSKFDPAKYQDMELLKKYRSDLQTTINKAKTEGKHASIIASLEDTHAGYGEIFKALASPQQGAADITFEDKMVLARGERRIEILYLGRANTDGDAIIWLPEEKIVITGDVVVRPTPYGFGSYPGDWADTIDKINALGYDKLVPGHGAVLDNSQYAEALAALFRDLTHQTQKAVAAGAKTKEDLAAEIDFSAHDKAIAGDNPLYLRLFQNWFKKPILDSALKEATGVPILQTQFVED